MATIELDIIKQRSEKLLPEEKLELIDYLAASLAPEELAANKNVPESDSDDRAVAELPDDAP